MRRMVASSPLSPLRNLANWASNSSRELLLRNSAAKSHSHCGSLRASLRPKVAATVLAVIALRPPLPEALRPVPAWQPRAQLLQVAVPDTWAATESVVTILHSQGNRLSCNQAADKLPEGGGALDNADLYQCLHSPTASSPRRDFRFEQCRGDKHVFRKASLPAERHSHRATFRCKRQRVCDARCSRCQGAATSPPVVRLEDPRA